MTTVLLVEDNADNRMVIEDIFEFEALDATLEVAETGEAALEILQTLRPELILMDLGLPGISGMETVRRIRETPGTVPATIWALTAHAMKDVRDEALAAGCNDYVTKPIDAIDFTRQLRAFVQAPGTRTAA